MSTVNFSVPEDIKIAFNSVFEGQNKSAVIADLMRDAVALSVLGAVLVTADRRYFDKAQHLGQIAWLGDFSWV